MILIANLQKSVRIPRAKVEAIGRRLLGKRSLSVAFVTDVQMRRVNRRFLRHDYVTDVLAFRLDGDPFGEVVVAPGVARREAARRGIPVEQELLRYVLHGILHLLGYDDRRPRDRRRMWARQERELRRVVEVRRPSRAGAR